MPLQPYNHRMWPDAPQAMHEWLRTIPLKGRPTNWLDDNFSGVVLGVGSSPPGLVAYNSGSIYVRAFDGNVTTEQLFGGAEYQHNGKEGASIYFHLHWCPTTADAGVVKWQIAYQWIDEDDSPVADTVISVLSTASGTAWKPQRADFDAVSGVGKKIGSQIGIRLFRNPSDDEDTYPADAAIAFTFGYHYEIDDMGSVTMRYK